MRFLFKSVFAAALAFAGTNVWGSVAKTADGREFDDLAAALAAVSPSNPLAEVDASVWPADKQAWYNGKFYAKFGCCQTSDVANDSALGAANAADSNEPAVIYCRPNATELSYQTHDQLRTSMTIYGNNARFKVAGWQPTVEHSSGSGDDGAHTLKKDITLAFYNLHDGACVWGVRTSTRTVSDVMENCENVRALMINGNKGSDKSTCNYCLKNCTFDRNKFSCGCPVTTTNPGEVIVENCTFKDYNDDYCFNINNKNGGELTVRAKACQFDNCGTSSKSAFRLMGEADGSSVDATLDGVSFANANRAYDIIVGKAEAVSNKAYVKYEIKNTSANIEVYSQNTAELKLGATLDAAKTYVGNNGVPEVVIDVPEPDEVVVKIEGEASDAQKSEKAAAVVSAIAKAADEESLEVRDSGLQAAAKTAEGKLEDELVTALKEKAPAEKKDEITSATTVKKTIDVVFKSMTVEAGENVTTTKIAYDVTPKATATLSGGEKVEAKIPNGTFGKINFRMPLTADFAGRWLKVSRTDNGTDFTEVGLFKAQKEGDVDFVQVDADHFSTYMNEITDKIPVAAIGGKGYATLQAAVDAVKEGETISLSVGTIEEDEITLPDTIKNVTIKGAADHASILKNTSLAHRTNGKSFDGLTIDGVVFDGGHFLMIDWGNGSLKNMTFTNNIFRNWSNAKNEAPVEFNESATTALNGLTFTGNVVEGCSGSNISGIYGYFTGDIKIEGNVFTEVPFCAALLNIADNDGVADNVVCTNNKIIAPGFNRAAFQIVFYEGTDNVNVTVNGNIFSGMTYELGVNTWGLGANVTADLTGNYFSQGGNGMIYWDGADDVKMSDVANAADLPHANSDNFTYYTGLTPDGEIDPATLVEVVKPPVAKIGDKGYATLEEAIAAVPEGLETPTTITMVADETITGASPKAVYHVTKAAVFIPENKSVILDLNGHTIEGKDDMVEGNFAFFAVRGKLIVDDTSASGDGLIVDTPSYADTTYYSFGGSTLQVMGGEFTLRNGTIQSLGNQGVPMAILIGGWDVGGTCRIEGGAVIANAYGIRLNPIFDNSGFEGAKANPILLEVTGGRVCGFDSIYFHRTGRGNSVATINITGGVMEFEDTGFYTISRKGDFTLNIGEGAEFRPTEDADEYASALVTFIDTVGAEANPDMPKTVFNITGGVFGSADNGNSLYFSDYYCRDNATITISGGDFPGYVECYGQDLSVTGGAFGSAFWAFTGSGETDPAVKCISGGIFAYDYWTDELVDGCIFVDNTDAATKAAYPWMIGPQQQQPKTEEATAEASDKAKQDVADEMGKTVEEVQTDINKAVADVKDEVVQAATSEEITQFTGTGLAKAVVNPDGSLDSLVVEALKAGKTPEQQQKIEELSSDSNSTKRIQIELKKVDVDLAVSSEKAIVGSADEVAYDVEPRVKTVIEVKDEQGAVIERIEADAKVPNDTIANSPITFRLGVTWAAGEKVEVLHDGEKFGITTVKAGADGHNYVELTSNRFSTFKLKRVNVPTVCKVDDLEFETIADAINGSVDDYNTTIEMLADVGSGVTVTGLGRRVIDTKGTTFEAEITPDAGTELVKGPEGKRYLAAPKVEVPTGESTVMPIRGYVFPGDLGGKTEGAYLADPGTTGAPRWQEYALYGNMSAEGTYVKLIPQIVKADEGSSVVTIKAADGFVLSKPVRGGVAVSFKLLKSDSVDGTFALYAENPIEPSFTVDVTAIGPKTFWKIQTIFSCEEER